MAPVVSFKRPFEELLKQLEASTAVFVASQGPDSDFWFIARAQRNTRLFREGDFAVGYYNNGAGERWPLWSKTSRGYTVRRLYVQCFRYQGRPLDLTPKPELNQIVRTLDRHNNKTPMKIVAESNDLANHTIDSLDSSALRRFIASSYAQELPHAR